MDNFEWSEGYSQRFGFVFVDFRTLKRTVKESGKWYAKLAATGKLSLDLLMRLGKLRLPHGAGGAFLLIDHRWL